MVKVPLSTLINEKKSSEELSANMGVNVLREVFIFLKRIISINKEKEEALCELSLLPNFLRNNVAQ